MLSAVILIIFRPSFSECSVSPSHGPGGGKAVGAGRFAHTEIISFFFWKIQRSVSLFFRKNSAERMFPFRQNFVGVLYSGPLFFRSFRIGAVFRMRFLPQAFCRDRPVLRRIDAFSGQFADILRADHVGRFRAGFFHHLGQASRIVQQGAGAQLIVVERLVPAVLHEQRGAERFQQCLFMDVGIRVMDERARLDVPGRIDVKVSSAAGDAAVHIFAVVPEVHREQRLGIAEFADLAVHEFALVRRGHQLGRGVVPDRHIGEEPREFRALVDQVVEELFAADGLRVVSGVAARSAERQLPAFQNLHRADDGLIGALPAPCVGVLFEALHADGGNEVLDAEHLVGECVVDQRRVGKRQKHAVAVLFAELDNVILAHERLAAGIDVKIDAELFALQDNFVQSFQIHGKTVAVVGRPASDAVQVAGGGGVHQDGPRDVAVVNLFQLILPFAAEHGRVDQEVFKHLFAHAGIDVVPKAEQKPVPVVVFIFNDFVEEISLAFKSVIPVKQVNPVQDFRHILFRVGVQIGIGEFHRRRTHFFNHG